MSEGLTLMLAVQLFRRSCGMRKSEQSPLPAVQVTIVEDCMEANLNDDLGLTVGLDGCTALAGCFRSVMGIGFEHFRPVRTAKR
ncbi:hypothetical protein [uncultured Marivita sp.]|uniref:hypothetical protein n=1 Tax=uncultured Marivita sp. TaxID=888080 RepID=UPI00261143A6|nr:hypothetical protein [uncultured Marivita sp.]